MKTKNLYTLTLLLLTAFAFAQTPLRMPPQNVGVSNFQSNGYLITYMGTTPFTLTTTDSASGVLLRTDQGNLSYNFNLVGLLTTCHTYKHTLSNPYGSVTFYAHPLCQVANAQPVNECACNANVQAYEAIQQGIIGGKTIAVSPTQGYTYVSNDTAQLYIGLRDTIHFTINYPRGQEDDWAYVFLLTNPALANTNAGWTEIGKAYGVSGAVGVTNVGSVPGSSPPMPISAGKYLDVAFQLPANTPLGNTRIRLSVDYYGIGGEGSKGAGNPPITGACGTQQYGSILETNCKINPNR